MNEQGTIIRKSGDDAGSDSYDETLQEELNIKNSNRQSRMDSSSASLVDEKVFRPIKTNMQSDDNTVVTSTSDKTFLFVCDICIVDNCHNIVLATASCKDCKELYCDTCTDIHRNQKITRSHTIFEHKNIASRDNCESCTKPNKIASSICIDCDEIQCADCCKVHTRLKVTQTHTVLNVNEKSASSTINDHTSANKYPLEPEKTRVPAPASEDLKISELKPGKPSVAGQLLIDSICLVWEAAKTTFDDHSYQIRMKEEIPDAKWTFYPEKTQSCSVTLYNLKSQSTYIFQVRMVNDETLGPYSESSDPVETLQSAAHHIIDFMYDVEKSDVGMSLKRLPLQENRKARNVSGKTRKLVVGNAKKTRIKEKTIMLVGATGTGKSTLVDGMINYILGVSWSDPYRLTLVDLEEDEALITGNQAVSQTQWVSCYTINPFLGSRLDYTLNIIDTPGFGDTRGIDRDREIIEQIRALFSKEDETGVLYIDAICFIIKAPDARLTPTQMYIFNAIMSLFGQDIKDNICMLVTFADGKKPPVLAALKEARLPYELFFPFNNSGLFAENSGENVSCFSQLFWDMGCKSFQTFFDKLLTLETKSLRQTRDVLEQRRLIEITMENLLPKLDAGLNKVEELRVEIQVLEDYKTLIECNSDFKYTVTETEQRQIDLPKGQHVTNCLNCHMTCHRNCSYSNDEDKIKCCAMDKKGFCRQCSGKCFWNIHRNTPYIFEYVSVKKEKTYTEKLEKYRRAQNENMTRQKVVERMHEEVYDLEGDILDLMEKINDCNNILRQIALKPDPLSVVEHIDLLIESEKMEKRPGFQARIASLQKCRKRATIGDDVDRFTTSFTNTSKIITAQVKLPPKPPRVRRRLGPPSFLQPLINFFQH